MAFFMELEDITNLSGVKLMDTSAYSHSKKSLLKKIYSCNSFGEIPLDSVEEEIEIKRECINIFSRQNVFTIKETGSELKVFLDVINDHLNFYSKSESISHKMKSLSLIAQKTIQKIRRANKFKEKRRGFGLNEDKHCSCFDLMNVLAKETAKIINFSLEKDIRKSFLHLEKLEYNKFYSYLSCVCKNFDIERDFHDRYDQLETHNSCKFNTDKKIVATAFVIANREKVNLVSSDSDIKRMLNFFYGGNLYKKDFNINEPKNKIDLFSRFEDTYKLQEI